MCGVAVGASGSRENVQGQTGCTALKDIARRSKTKIWISNFTPLRLQKHYLSGICLLRNEMKHFVWLPLSYHRMIRGPQWPLYHVRLARRRMDAPVFSLPDSTAPSSSVARWTGWCFWRRVSCISLLTKIRYYTGWITFKAESKREAISVSLDLTVLFSSLPSQVSIQVLVCRLTKRKVGHLRMWKPSRWAQVRILRLSELFSHVATQVMS